MYCLGMKGQGIRLSDQEWMAISLFLILKTEREFPHIYHFSLTKFKYPRFCMLPSLCLARTSTKMLNTMCKMNYSKMLLGCKLFSRTYVVRIFTTVVASSHWDSDHIRCVCTALAVPTQGFFSLWFKSVVSILLNFPLSFYLANKLPSSRSDLIC